MATNSIRPIRSKADYEAALAEVEQLWGAKAGTAKGDRLDVLATLIDVYEAEHYPMDPPDTIEAIKFLEKRMAEHPELIERPDRAQLRRIAKLVEHVESE